MKEIKINEPNYEPKMTKVEKLMHDNDENIISAIYDALDQGDAQSAKALFEIYESVMMDPLSQEDYDAVIEQCEEAVEDLY